MSTPHSNAQEEQAHVITWALASVICLVLFALLFWILGPGRATETSQPVHPNQEDEVVEIPVPEGMNWPALSIDGDRILRAREAQRTAYKISAKELAQKATIQSFYERVKELNDHQFITQPIPSKKPDELEYNFKASLGEVIEAIEPAEFMALGEPLFKECEAGLKALQQDIARGETTLEDAKEDADFEKHERYRKHCGNMLTQLHELGLIKEDGTWMSEDARIIATILERYRWAYLVHLYVKPLDLLTAPERTIFLRWRLEADAFPLEQRKRFASTILQELPSYPPGIPEAMLAYEEGEKRRAAEILSRYKNRSPDDPNYKVMYEAIQKELDIQ